MLHDIHTRALRRAAEILGGNEQVRAYLGASELDLSNWTQQGELPRNMFLRLVDLITDEDVRRVQMQAAKG